MQATHRTYPAMERGKPPPVCIAIPGMGGMIISLPWPDKRLTPNAKRRKHWSGYRPAEKADRTTAQILTLSAMQHQRVSHSRFAGDDKIPVNVTFFPPDRRHRDDDGMIGAFKHMRDGIADALGVNDRRFLPTYAIADADKPGRVVVEIGA